MAQYKIFDIEDPWWGTEHRNLPFVNEPFNNSQDLETWRELGYTQTRFTGDMYDMRQTEPAWIIPFRDLIAMPNFSWSVYCMRPGDCLPPHSDLYRAFRRIHNLTDSQSIRRYVVFLEPRQSGHFFEIDGEQISDWRAGTTVMWDNDTVHAAGNMGLTNRYTLQLTGTVRNSIS